MDVRTVDPSEVELCARLGRMVVEAYVSLPGHVHEPDYEAELADVAGRAGLPDTAVLAALDGDVPLGCVTYVASAASPLAEGIAAGEAAFRMLGVAPDAQGRGAGRALVEACIERAVASGSERVALHTTPWMGTAHRLYESLGFERDPERDWTPVPDVPLLGYCLDLAVRRGSAPAR